MDICRICYEADSLISVCQCNGTMKFVHEKCIRKWIEVSNKDTCELCLQPYTIEIKKIKKKTYNWTNAPVLWTILGIGWAYLHAVMVLNNTTNSGKNIYGLIFITGVFNALHFILWGFVKRFDPIFSLISLAIWITIFISLSLGLQVDAGQVSSAILAYCITIVSFMFMFFNTLH